VLKELPNPSLELFDLDDEFSQEKVRLAQLTNKCEDTDLEYFIREAGDILGISDKVKNRSEPKAILKYILDQIVSALLSRSTSRRITLFEMMVNKP
jgi:intraflagellar transport protein 52